MGARTVWVLLGKVCGCLVAVLALAVPPFPLPLPSGGIQRASGSCFSGLEMMGLTPSANDPLFLMRIASSPEHLR